MSALLASRDAQLNEFRLRISLVESEYQTLDANRYTVTKEEARKWQLDKLETVEATLFKGIQILNMEKGMREGRERHVSDNHQLP